MLSIGSLAQKFEYGISNGMINDSRDDPSELDDSDTPDEMDNPNSVGREDNPSNRD